MCVVDGDAETRELLRRVVESGGLDVNTFADADALLKALPSAQPGCLLLNAGTDGASGLELERELTARKVAIPMIMTTRHADVATAVEAMKAGAFDVVEKPIPIERLITSIREAIAEERRMRRARAERDGIRLRYVRLTRREREVLDLVVAGLTSSVIAAQLGLREKTVEVYRSGVKRKMRARNTADMVRMVHCLG